MDRPLKNALKTCHPEASFVGKSPQKAVRAAWRGRLVLGALALLLATQPGASCISNTDGGSSTSGSGNDNSRPDARTSGTINGIPRRATIGAEGRGDLDYTVDADGQIYVQDLRDDSLVVDHHAHRGDRVRLVIDDNRVKLNDDTIYHDDLKSDHVHRIYLDRDFRNDRYDNRNDTRNDNGRNDNRSNDRGNNSGSSAIPSGSTLMGRGQNREITFTATRDGNAYLYDEDAGRVVDSTPISRGQRFTFSPGRHRATVDGRAAIDDGQIDFSRKYAVYFTHD